MRKAPAPDGRAGFIRIDSVHQGDLDGTKGLYHINAVDCVTQWQVVATVQTICNSPTSTVAPSGVNEVSKQFEGDPPLLAVAVERGGVLIDAHDQADAVLQILVDEVASSRCRIGTMSPTVETLGAEHGNACADHIQQPDLVPEKRTP